MLQKIVSFFLLIVLSPILLISIALLKIESPQLSPIFKQKRVGENGVLFDIYKLRTMRPYSKEQLKDLQNFNEQTEVIFKMKKDPRVTPVGHWLRKFSIDEFLQLFNVLIGNMALIGPRPALSNEVIHYSPLDSKRLSVLPGCTGLWQVSGRSDLSFQEMVRLDLEYINKKKLSFDLLILGKTILVVLIGKGAY